MKSVRGILQRVGKDERLVRVLHGGFSAFLGRGLALLVSAVTLPLTVRYLGPLEYGIWVTISTSVVMLSVLDLGIANTLTNYIAKAYSKNDEQEAQRYFATAFWLTIGIMLGLSVMAFAAWRYVDWAALLNIQDAAVAERARACVGISAVYFLLSLPLNLAGRALSGYQQNHIANYFAMINSGLGFIAILTVVAMKGSMVMLMAAFCAAMLTGSLILNVWVYGWFKAFLRPMPWLAERALARGFIGEGFLFFLLQLCGLVVYNSDNLVISHYLSAREVTPYSVAWRLVSYAAMLQSLLIPSLWPAFTEAYHRRDMDWLRKTYRRTTRTSLLVVSVAALLAGLLGRTLIRYWAGEPAVPSLSLMWCMAFWAVLVATTTNQALLLTATSRLKLESSVALIAAVANVFLSIHLVTRLGSLGVLLSTIVSFLVFMIGPQEWEVRRVLTGKYLPAAEAVVQVVQQEPRGRAC